MTASGIGLRSPFLEAGAGRSAPGAGVAARRVLPSTLRTGKGGAGGETVAGPAGQAPAALKPPADTPIAVRDMTLRRHPPSHPHPHSALGGDAARPRRPRPRQVVQRRAQDPLGVLVHHVGDRPGSGGSRAAGRLRRRVQARARHHERAPRALHRPRLRPLRRRRSRRSRSRTCPKGYRYYTVIQLAVHYGYMAPDAAGNFRPTEPVAASTAETVDDPLAQGALLLLQLVAAEHARAQPLAAQHRLDDRRSVLPALDHRLAAARAALQPLDGRRRARGHPDGAHRPRRGRLHVLPRLPGGRRVAAVRASPTTRA